MADLTGGDLVARVLKQAGVGHIFTLCGGHILPIYDGCITRTASGHGHAPRAGRAPTPPTPTRGSPATSAWRSVTAGPGVTDAVTGVANAYSAREPAAPDRRRRPARAARARARCRRWSRWRCCARSPRARGPVAETRQIPEVLTTAIRRRADRAARAGVRRDPGGPADDDGRGSAWRRSRPPTCIARRRPATRADRRAAGGAARPGAERPVVMAGSGVYWDDAAQRACAAFAERAGRAGVHERRRARHASRPITRWRSRRRAASRCGQADVVLVLGAPLDFRLGYGRPPTFAEDAQVAMVDCDPAELGRNRPLAVGLASHIGRALRSARRRRCRAGAGRARSRTGAPRCAKKETRGAQARLMARARARTTCRSAHYRLGARDRRAGRRPTRIVVGDGGDVVGCASKIVPLARPGQWLDPGPVRLPRRRPVVRDRGQAAAILTRRVLLIAGDGAFGLNGMEMETGRALRPADDRASSATTAAGARSAIRSCRSSAPSARWHVAAVSRATTCMVEALGGQRRPRDASPRSIGPALERALGVRRRSGASMSCRPGGVPAYRARFRWRFDLARGGR